MNKTYLFGIAVFVLAALAMVPEGHAVIYDQLYCNSSTNYKQHGAGSVLVVANNHCSYLLNDANQQLINVSNDPGTGIVYYDMVNYNNSQTSISGSPYGDNIWFTVRNATIDAYVDTNDISGWSRQATETTYQVAGYVGTLTNNIAFAHTAYQQYNLSLKIDYDNGHAGLLVNGVQSGANFSLETGGEGQSITIGTDYGNSGVIAWDKICVRDDATAFGCPYVAPPPAGPYVTISAPVNNTKWNPNFGDLLINFTLNNVATGISCVSAYHNQSTDNNTWTTCNTTTVTSGNYSVGCSVSGNDDLYYFQTQCNSSQYNTSLRYAILDTVSPSATLNPSNFFAADNTTIIGSATAASVLFNFTFADDNDLYGLEMNVTHSDGTVVLSVLNESFSGTSQLWTYTGAVSGAQGNYTANLTIYDSHTAKKIKDYKVKKEADKLVFDDVITIEAPGAISSDAEKEEDRYSFTFDYTIGGGPRIYYVESNGDLVYKPDSGYVAHFVDFKNKRWIDFEGPMTYAVVTKEKKNRYKVFFSSTPKTVKFHSIGGLNSVSYLYEYHLTKNIEMDWISPADGIGVIDLGYNSSFVNLSVTAEYRNRTEFYLYNSSGAILQNYNVTHTGAGTTYANWTIGGLLLNLYYVNASHYDLYGNVNHSGSIELRRTVLDNCSASTNKTATFTIYNENAPTTTLNSTVEFDVEYWNPLYPDSIFYYNVEMGDDYAFDLCLVPFENAVNANVYFRYDSGIGFTHRYYLFNHTFSNVSQSFSVYNYNYTTGVSDLKLTTRYQTTYGYYPNVVTKLLRSYAGEGVWRTVQMDKTGDYGLAFFNILEENQDYKLLFYDTDNHLLDETASMKFVCTSGICDVTQLLNPYSASATSTNLSYSYGFNNATNIITVNWTDPLAGTTSARLIVTKQGSTGLITICDDTQAGASGSFSCNVTGYSGEVAVALYSSASPEEGFFKWYIVLSRPLLSSTLSIGSSALWTAAILITVAGFGIISPAITVIATIIGLIAVSALGLFAPITNIFLIVACVIGIIIAVRVRQ